MVAGTPHARPSPRRPIEWFRPNVLGRTMLVWIAASGVMSLGLFMLVAGIDSSGRVPPSLQTPLVAAGISIVITGVLVGASGIFHLVGSDTSALVLRADGVAYYRGQRDIELVPWRDLHSVEATDDGLELLRDDGPPLRIAADYGDISHEELASRIRQLQRRVLMGLRV